MIVSKNIKTDCGESLFFRFSYTNNKINIELEEKGSQFLALLKDFIIKIINNKPLKYTEQIEKIFWKIFPLKIEGKKKIIAEQILFELKMTILVSCREKLL